VALTAVSHICALPFRTDFIANRSGGETGYRRHRKYCSRRRI
jgi:hypothetical protein